MSVAIYEVSNLADEAIRRDVIASGQPAVLRGLVSNWPAVQQARSSSSALANYLRQFDNGAPVDAIMTPPEMNGRIFYNDAMDGFNYLRNRLPLSAIVEQVLRYAAFPRPPAVAAQSALIRDCIPGFLTENRLTLLDESIAPRIWLGNAVTTPTHVDEWCNIACVVGGRRRFTLFPPEQITNLYVGPLDFAPTGAPMSLVKLGEPDFERFPRFRDALAAAQVADLESGDALFIPPLWWHNVESRDAFNVLVNYWWHAASGAQSSAGSAFDSLLHGILSVRSLPPETRRAWSALFQHYIFGAPEGVTGHIPAARRGILGALSPQDLTRLRADLARRLDAPAR
ncbi:MAG TPA: cupin-like domain-containing protein [Burkholderiaceae bacterium]|nr:cupin-like domain-containing protein [Burkholderiaceae bacterium]